MSDPFTYEIRVGWGDCDPAKIAYTARIPEWAIEAIDAWWEWALGADAGWFHTEMDRGFGSPFVHLSMDFRAPVTPRHRLICTVWPTKVGHTSVAFRVEGRQDGALCFEGRFVTVLTDAMTFTKIEPPDDVKALLASHLRPEPE